VSIDGGGRAGDAGRSYWERALRRPVGRRSLIRAAGIAGSGVAGAALIGCGSSGNSTPTATAAAAQATAAGTTAAATATATAAPQGPKTGGTYSYLLAIDPTSLDPYANLSYSAKGVAAHVYSRLFRIDAQPNKNPYEQKPIPDLAESAESPDGITWTVKLKQGAKFHNVAPVNGREVTTEDVMFSWGRLTDPASPALSLVPQGMTLQAIDKYTLQFKLSAPSPTFLEFLADANILWIQPKEAGGGFDPTQKPIGSGPWVLSDYVISSKMTYKKHPEYFVKGLPYLDGLEEPIIPEYGNGKAQFEAGNLSYFYPQADDVLTMKSANAKLQWSGINTALLFFIYFSPESMDPKAPWRDARFRQGVSMAVDRDGTLELESAVKELSAAGLTESMDWNNIVPAGFGSTFWLDPKSAEQGPSSKYFEYNTAEAKKMFDAVGASANEPFTYQYTGNGYGSVWVTYAEAAGNWMKDAGLQPQTQTQDYSSKYITHTFRGDFHGLAYGIETPFPEAGSYFNRMFGDDPANHGKISDPQITDLTKKQAVELDEATRAGYMKQIQKISDEQMYYVPLPAHSTLWYAYQPQVRGIRQTRGYGGPTEQLMYYWLNT
jgi:peptide/nickel transport system substrate-binding protein